MSLLVILPLLPINLVLLNCPGRVATGHSSKNISPLQWVGLSLKCGLPNRLQLLHVLIKLLLLLPLDLAVTSLCHLLDDDLLSAVSHG